MLICADAPLINNPANNYRPSPGQAYKLNSLPRLWRKRADMGNYGGYAFAYINQRDAGSNGMSDCFDFAQQPLAPPGSAGGAGP